MNINEGLTKHLPYLSFLFLFSASFVLTFNLTQCRKLKILQSCFSLTTQHVTRIRLDIAADLSAADIVHFLEGVRSGEVVEVTTSIAKIEANQSFRSRSIMVCCLSGHKQQQCHIQCFKQSF